MGEVKFMISEAAKQVHVESHVLRYWEEELHLSIGRTENGHRYYTNDDIQLFKCIKKLKDEGMLLKDLKPLIPQLKSTKEKIHKPPSNTVPAVLKTEVQKSISSEIYPDKLEQTRALFGGIFSEILSTNNETLKQEISQSVTKNVIREVDFLFQAKERQEEEHFRKLDCLIRQQQANRKESARENPLMKLKKILT